MSTQATLVAIAGMAVVTYLTRVGGFWLVDRIELSEHAQSFLRYVPAAVLVSLILPTLLEGGPADVGAAGVTLVVAVRTGNILYAMIVGIATVVIFRRVIGLG